MIDIATTLQLAPGATVPGGVGWTHYDGGGVGRYADSPFVASGLSWSCSASGGAVVETGWISQLATMTEREVAASGTYGARSFEVFPPPSITFGAMTLQFNRSHHLFML